VIWVMVIPVHEEKDNAFMQARNSQETSQKKGGWLSSRFNDQKTLLSRVMSAYYVAERWTQKYVPGFWTRPMLLLCDVLDVF